MDSTAAGGLVGDRYLLGELLGVGGTGSVFAAEDTQNPDARVAIKLLHPHLCSDEASRDAFLREAQHAARIVHPNVVFVRGAGMHDAGGLIMPWIAFDLVQGPTLRERVEREGPLAVADVVAVGEGLLAGLAAAHRVGVVHRDISPNNVILEDATAVRIIDFGLADVTGRSTRGGNILLTSEKDGECAVVGNAAYMSPEQAQGLPVRSVSDLYQVGAVLYFAATGLPPFPRATTTQVMQAHVAAPPPVLSALVPVARPLDRIITRAMAKTPALRFRDAEEFRGAIAAVMVAPIAADAADAAATRTDAESHTRLLPAGVDDADPFRYLFADAGERPSEGATTDRSRGGLAVAVVGTVIVGLAAWGVVTAAGSPDTPDTPVSTPERSAPAVLEPSPEASPTTNTSPPAVAVLESVSVPTLRGSLAEAEAQLTAAGLILGRVTYVESPIAADQVLTQYPLGGAAAAGSTVDLTVASGKNVVPPVSGLTFAAASALLTSAGFLVSGDRPDATASMVVIRSDPDTGAVLPLGASVTLIRGAATPSPSPLDPSPTPSSTPG